MPVIIDEDFLSQVPIDWDLVTFLGEEYQSSRKHKTPFNFNKVVDHYLASLNHIVANTKDVTILSKAKLLLTKYSRGGRISDKARSRCWDKNRLTGRRQKRVSKPQVVIHQNNGTIGTVVRGNVGTLNSFPQPHAGFKPIGSTLGSKEVEIEGEQNNEDDSIASESVTLTPEFETNQSMDSKFPLVGGVFLEDIARDYAKEFSDIDQLNLPSLSIIDAHDKDFRDLFDDDQWKQIVDESPPIPQLPCSLADHITSYTKCATTDDCIETAYSTESGWDKSTPEYSDKRWIDNVMEHTLFLLTQTSNLLDYRGLKEGVWDSLYAHVMDACILRLAHLGLFMQRKEIILAAHTSDPDPFISPYVRYDGIVQTRWQYHSRHLEYAVVEVSSSSDSKTSNEGKRDKDLTKLLAGCRAILNNLKKIVNYDPETVKKLVVVGVLHEGRFTQVLYMSCVGHNMFYLRSGELRPFPENIESIHKACDLLTIIWKVKAVIRDCHSTVTEYLDQKKKSQAIDRRAVDFL
ncbi:uncharacterized protein H6S33_000401 [Morchella sextelata]|uniref:uncharacterized protein n=1 Tax=Morchella sextelata TaxID=1174677 RepID=UPI001D045626|nr:uncharacterized protein H6S33_000401 [Morchella sextelata]KAH0614765.1 hypothetical protein H6S33_000401 [Morchella sextelata]